MGLFGKKEPKINANIIFAGAFSADILMQFKKDKECEERIRRTVAMYTKDLPGPSKTWFFDEWSERFYTRAVIDKVFDNGFDNAFDKERELVHVEIINKLKKAHGIGMIDSGQPGVIHPKCVIFKDYYLIVCNARVNGNELLEWH